MAETAGIVAMLAMGALAVWVLLGVQRSLAPSDADPDAREGGGGAETDRSARSGPATRARVGFLLGGLVFLVVAVGLLVLAPWAVSARALGTSGLVAFGVLTVPVGLGLLHAASRGSIEW